MYRPLAAIGFLLGALSAGGPAFAQVSCTVNYTCSNSQCAAAIGGYNVTKGPFSFSSESACLSQARQGMSRATCSCRAGGATSAGATPSANQSPEAAAVDAMNSVIRSGNFATANNATMTMGAGIATGVAVLVLRSALQGPSPEELARREAIRQEQLRLQAEAEERARIEAEQRHRRIVAGLQGTTLSADEAPRLAGAGDLRIDAPTATAGNLALLKTDAAPPPAFAQSGSRWSAQPAAPASPGGNLALLKRGDDSPEAASDAARRPFDTAGALPAAPAPAQVAAAAVATPAAVPVGGVAAAAPATAVPGSGSAGDEASSIMANRKPRPEIRISGGVDVPGPAYRPGQAAGTAGEGVAPVAPVASAAPQPGAQASGAANPAALSAAYNRGYKEAQSCVSQNAGNACQDSGSGQAHLACVSSYQQGYAAGAGPRDALIQGTENAGRLDKAAGRDKGATPISPQIDAGCSIEATQAYNRGYGL